MLIKQAITFAQLAYLDFKSPESMNSEHLIGANQDDYTVKKLTTLMYKSYLRDLTPNKKNREDAQTDANKFKATFASTLNTMSDWSIVDVLDDNGSSASNSGFYGVSFFNKRTKELVVSFRGTEPNKDNFKDIGADTSISTNDLDFRNQYNDGISLIQSSLAKLKDVALANICLAGHSLGGALVQKVMELKNNKSITFGTSNDKIMEGVTFNAPGIGLFFSSYDKGSEAGKKVINYIMENDKIGNINGHYGTTLLFLI